MSEPKYMPKSARPVGYMPKSARPVDESPAPVRPSIGPAETVLGKYVESVPLATTVARGAGTLGLQLLKALGAVPSGVRLTEKAKEEMRAAGMEDTTEESSLPGWGETWRRSGKEIRERTDMGAAQNPGAGALGTGLGVATSLALPVSRAMSGASWAGRLGNAALTQGAIGTILSGERSKADVTKGMDDVEKLAKDALGVEGIGKAIDKAKQGNKLRALLELSGAGALGGAATGTLVGAAGEVARLASAPLRRLAVRKTKDVLQGGSDIAAPTRKPLSDEAAAEVLDSGLVGTSTAKTYENVERAASELGDKYGAILDKLEALGVKGPDAKALAKKILDRATELEPGSFDDAMLQTYRDAAAKIQAKAPQRPYLPDDFPEEMRGLAPGMEPGELGLRQGENLKRSAQTAARLDRLKNSSTQEAWEEVGSTLRQATEDSIDRASRLAGPESEVAALGADFKPTKQALGKLLEARTAAERGVVKANARYSGPGLPDLILGASTGNPATAYLTAMGSKFARGALPSVTARNANSLSKALRSGAASSTLAKYLAVLRGEVDENGSPTDDVLTFSGLR